MILELDIKNFAILENLQIQFGPGLNVFTGETGAGKSLLLSALAFLLGESSSVEGQVQGIFLPTQDAKEFLTQEGFEIGSELYISREVKANSRSVSRLNGTLVPLGKIKGLSPFLVEIQAQHSHNIFLLEGKAPLLFLDAFGGNQSLDKREKVSAAYVKLQNLKKELALLQEKTGDRQQRIDLCQYEIDEIKKANLQDGEEEILRSEREKLSKIERLTLVLEELQLLAENTKIQKILSHLQTLSPYDKNLEPWLSKLNDFQYEWDEFMQTLTQSHENFLPNPARLEKIVERLDQLHRLQKKYGLSGEAILHYAQERESELQTLLNLEETFQNANQKIRNTEDNLHSLSSELSTIREKNAASLSKAMKKELEELSLPEARFEAVLEVLESCTASGKEKVSFLVSFNRGERLLPLEKVASGGELSRLMLALKTLLSSDAVPTLVFDEVDAGLGGEAAFQVAERLQKLSQKKQILCVTHLHQVASVANNHFRLEKYQQDEKTNVVITPLSKQEKVKELTRMMAGQRTTTAAFQHAEELLKQSQGPKRAQTRSKRS